MSAPNLKLVRTREQTIEEALQALINVMKDKSIPHKVRYRCAQVHTDLHACRSVETVRRMEQEQGLR